MTPLLYLAMASANAECPTSTAAEATAPLSVVTLNAWGLPAPVAVDRRGRLPRIARWLDEQGYDVAGLQEVWRGALRLLPRPGAGLMAPQAGQDHGLALVTPHEVHGTEIHAYSSERGFDAWKGKALLVAHLAVDDGRELTVGVTHLQAGGGRRNSAVRSQQVDELLSVLQRDDHATVLMGDFNLYEDEPTDAETWSRLEEAGFVDVAARTGATRGTYPGRSDRFDRIYVRDGDGRCWRPQRAEVLETELSDHRPVEATVDYTRR